MRPSPLGMASDIGFNHTSTIIGSVRIQRLIIPSSKYDPVACDLKGSVAPTPDRGPPGRGLKGLVDLQCIYTKSRVHIRAQGIGAGKSPW